MNKRKAQILDGKGNVIFEQDNVEAPESWSDTAVNIVASKYFYGKQGSPDRETSIYDVINRIIGTIGEWGWKDAYFGERIEQYEFERQLKYLLIEQNASFNSPVWFNLGTPGKQTTSACFILDVQDNIESIVKWWETETFIFNSGSGSGINVSNLRASTEYLSSGGKSSGPISFMRAADSMASVIKSGGKVRRAAKLVVMDDNHPDIEQFIQCKVDAEEHLRVLYDAGITKSLDDDHVGVPFQSSNHTISISDEFMERVRNDRDWPTFLRNTPNAVGEVYKARDLFWRMCEAIHFCGDPGFQFTDTINSWNTVIESGYIKGSNPCGEFLFIPNSACNLAVLKLTAFYDSKTKTFDIDSFLGAVYIMITAQDILIDNSDFPTPEIKENSKKFRPLGLGYSDLGALLMKMGVSYDSDEGRAIAGSIASLMTAAAYTQSWRLAQEKGPFSEFYKNEKHMREVIEKHKQAIWDLKKDILMRYDYIANEAVSLWDDLDDEEAIFRNSQVTLMAPNGTTGMQLDCDTLGMEPEFSLVRHKKMAGGGYLKIVNNAFKESLENLGYNPYSVGIICNSVAVEGNLEDCQLLEKEHLPIFDCALPLNSSGRCLTPEAHIRMIAAIQPHVSGGISKTVNLPSEVTIEQIWDLTFLAWELGVKGLTFYRDGCKVYQPLTTTKEIKKIEIKEACPIRKKLPSDCISKRHKFRVGEIEGYLHCGLYEDGSLGEVFITISKEGSTIAGLMDTIATLTSISLQYGVPLETLVSKFSYVRFEPSGFTDNPTIKTAKSVVDYVFRYLGENYSTNCNEFDPTAIIPPSEAIKSMNIQYTYSAPPCPECGAILRRSGSCYTCEDCAYSSGCG